MKDCLKMAAALKDFFADAKGFIYSERFSSLATKGKLLSMSVWENEECAEKWRNLVAHCIAQNYGRINDFLIIKSPL